jgi:hypothetical protein
MRHSIDVSETGITVTSARGRVRHLSASDVRQIHTFIDASGEQGVVVRRNLVQFVYIPDAVLSDRRVADGLRALIEATRSHARTDECLDGHLAQVTTSALLAA